jgi:hypothetical protein
VLVKTMGGHGAWQGGDKGPAFLRDPLVPPAEPPPAAFCDPALGLQPTQDGRCICMPGDAACMCVCVLCVRRLREQRVCSSPAVCACWCPFCVSLQALAPTWTCARVRGAPWAGTAGAAPWVSPTASPVRSCPPVTRHARHVVSLFAHCVAQGCRVLSVDAHSWHVAGHACTSQTHNGTSPHLTPPVCAMSRTRQCSYPAVQKQNVIRPNVPASLCEPCVLQDKPFAPPQCCPRGQVGGCAHARAVQRAWRE